MTDLEISKALALSIGWTFRQIGENSGFCYVNTHDNYQWDNKWRIFDYRDWEVIGPIAERYDCFPTRGVTDGYWHSWGLFQTTSINACADTPQKAIAMAVIEGAKK